MKFVRKAVSVRSVVLLIAQVIVGIPAAAQQDVSPDHFDQKPATSQNQKPAPLARRSANQSQTAKQQPAGRKAKPSPGKPAVLNASAATNQTGTQPH